MKGVRTIKFPLNSGGTLEAMAMLFVLGLKNLLSILIIEDKDMQSFSRMGLVSHQEESSPNTSYQG